MSLGTGRAFQCEAGVAEAWAAAENGSHVPKVKVTLWVTGSVGVRERGIKGDPWFQAWVTGAGWDGAGCHPEEKH